MVNQSLGNDVNLVSEIFERGGGCESLVPEIYDGVVESPVPEIYDGAVDERLLEIYDGAVDESLLEIFDGAVDERLLEIFEWYQDVNRDPGILGCDVDESADPEISERCLDVNQYCFSELIVSRARSLCLPSELR